VKKFPEEARSNAHPTIKPVVFIVGADKGGVGKTTVSRALINFLHKHNVPTRAFDTETPRGTLVRFYPDITEVVDISSVEDQMKILDGLAEGGAVTVIDIRAGQLRKTLGVLDDIGFLEASRSGEVALCLIHVLGSSVASLDEIQEVAPVVRDCEYVLARNFINDSGYFEWDPATYEKYFDPSIRAAEIVVPKLNELAYEKVDLANAQFNDFVENRDRSGNLTQHSYVLRGYVRKWVNDLDHEFDKIGLLRVLGRLASIR